MLLPRGAVVTGPAEDSAVPLADRIRNAPHGATLPVRPWEVNPANSLIGQFRRHDLGGLLIIPEALTPAEAGSEYQQGLQKLIDAVRDNLTGEDQP
jgi:hypothetical protein